MDKGRWAKAAELMLADFNPSINSIIIGEACIGRNLVDEIITLNEYFGHLKDGRNY
jgi:hypothetical protein